MHVGANWRAVDKEGDTILHLVCMKETKEGLHDSTLEFLLTSPAAVLKDAQNNDGNTPIMVATRLASYNYVIMMMIYCNK